MNRFFLNALFLIGLTVGLAQSNVPNNLGSAVRFTPQTLTVAQSLQALKNQKIGVNSSVSGQVLVSTGTATAPTWQAVGAASGVTICDAKSGFQTVDHGGWIIMNGRLKTALTSTQQTAATSCAFGANIPNASGRGFTQGTLGSQIGSSTITQAQLPNVNLVGGAHVHGITDPGHTHSSQILTHTSTGDGFNPGAFQLTDRTRSVVTNATEGPFIFNSTTGITINSSGNLSIPLGGSGATYTPASIGVNQFVFLGP